MRTIDRADGDIRVIDQTRLPAEESVLSLGTAEELAEAISSLRVRGAPALGVAGDWGSHRDGLSPEVFAANPEIGRLMLPKPAGGENEYGTDFTIPPDTSPGGHKFAFFTASNKYYVEGDCPC